MKKIIIFLSIFIASIAYSQQKNIYVEYGLTIQNELELFKNNTTLRSFFENAMSSSYKINFGLIITKEGSKFFDKEILENENNPGQKRFTLAMSGYKGIVYNLEKKVLINNQLLGKNIYSEGDLQRNWILTNETKLIDNYLCYKATNIYKVTNGEKIFNHAVIAWFCPKLPYPFGPNGYGNLPGLILELQVRNIVFGAKIIKLDSELDFEIKFLDKIKILNPKEIEEAYDKI